MFVDADFSVSVLCKGRAPRRIIGVGVNLNLVTA